MSSAQALFAESKARISERIQGSVKDAGSLARQVARGSKSSEIIGQATKQFAMQDYAIENTEINLRKMENINSQIKIQLQRTRINEVDHITNRIDGCLSKLHKEEEGMTAESS